MKILRENNKKGFSLIELLVVIVLIAIISVIVFVNFGNQTPKARNAMRLDASSKILTAFQLANLEEKISSSSCISGSDEYTLTGTLSGTGCNVILDGSQESKNFLKDLKVTGTFQDPLNETVQQDDFKFEFNYKLGGTQYEFAYLMEPTEKVSFVPKTFALDYSSGSVNSLHIDGKFPSIEKIITPIRLKDRNGQLLFQESYQTGTNIFGKEKITWFNKTNELSLVLKERMSFSGSSVSDSGTGSELSNAIFHSYSSPIKFNNKSGISFPALAVYYYGTTDWVSLNNGDLYYKLQPTGINIGTSIFEFKDNVIYYWKNSKIYKLNISNKDSLQETVFYTPLPDYGPDAVISVDGKIVFSKGVRTNTWMWTNNYYTFDLYTEAVSPVVNTMYTAYFSEPNCKWLSSLSYNYDGNHPNTWIEFCSNHNSSLGQSYGSVMNTRLLDANGNQIGNWGDIPYQSSMSDRISQLAIKQKFIGNANDSGVELPSLDGDLYKTVMINGITYLQKITGENHFLQDDGTYKSSEVANVNTGIYINIDSTVPNGTDYKFYLANKNEEVIYFSAEDSNTNKIDLMMDRIMSWNGNQTLSNGKTTQQICEELSVGEIFKFGADSYKIDRVDCYGDGNFDIRFKTEEGGWPLNDFWEYRGIDIKKGSMNYKEIPKNKLDGNTLINLVDEFGEQTNNLWYKIQIIGDSNDTTKTPVINSVKFSK